MSGFKFMRFVLLGAVSAFCQAYGPAWTKSGVITIGTTPLWANYTGAAITNFPILVRLDSAVFKFSEAKAGGADIGFANAANDKKLPFEIESWDAVAGKASIWVSVPSVGPNVLATIKMFWGNPAATSESSGPAVFGADYVGVWHLAEAASSATNKDASGHGLDGTKTKDDNGILSANATVMTPLESPLGVGQALNRQQNNLGFSRVDSAKAHLSGKNLTVSAWIKRDSINHSGDFFASQGTQDPNQGMRLGFDNVNRFLYGFDGGGTFSDDATTAADSTLDWHYWVGTFDNTTKSLIIYKDGVRDTAATKADGYLGNGFLDFGWAYGPSGEYFHPQGGLDEVRISTSVGNANAIKLSYLNQNASQGLVSYPVPAGCTESFSATQPAGNVTEGSTETLVGTAKCAQRFAWYRLEGTTEVPVEANGVNLTIPTRTVGQSTLKYRFKAMINGAWQQKDVTVTLAEAIPEPIFTLQAPATFGRNDTNHVTLYPVISNKAALLALGDKYKLNYKWTWDPPGVNDAAEKPSDTLKLVAFQAGSVHVKLCIDNGGAAVCKEATIAVTGVRQSARFDRHSFELKGNILSWKQNATIKVWDMGGKLVFSKTGNKGQQLALTPAMATTIFAKDHILKVFPANGTKSK